MKRKYVLICIGVLALVQTASYFLTASRRIPELALRVTPEHTHFRKGTVFSWAVVTFGKSSNLTAKQQDLVLSRFRQRYDSVFTSLADVPSELVMRDDYGRINGLKGGFQFSFRVVSRGPFWARVVHSDYEGNLASSDGERVFVWVLGTWVKLYDRLLTIS